MKPIVPELAQLAEAALAARRQAHAPYSGFSVGAAILARDGSVFPGANVENASYGLTICAERVALFTAVAAGQRRFAALAVAADGPTVPCGACLQALAEFNPKLALVLADSNGSTRILSLDLLLPEPFSGRKS